MTIIILTPAPPLRALLGGKETVQFELEWPRLIRRVLVWLEELVERTAGTSHGLPGEDDLRPPDCEKPAPLSPTGGHHLVAAQALPPAEGTSLRPKD